MEYRTSDSNDMIICIRKTYVDVNVFVDHAGPVNAFNDGSWAGVLEDRSRHVKFFVKRTDNEVAVQYVVASCVNQGYTDG